ncbi:MULTISPECIES: molecular chaperone DnaJ [Pseudomonas]|uniref:Molecular chaperone DnaJ n=1 Tax=Pseudomonas gingeri TaxID=117681 RepID=A0A7Y7WMQ6_9PSED|nr:MULTISPECIES: molecular chaperone DnaJ [Pseudomonas]MPQ70859.1 molecular chaperone DnaJ [Pseudomonas sp. MWU12-2323]NWB84356.1 molecular chaperone DnaJ [Pseudomonas gingeri]
MKNTSSALNIMPGSGPRKKLSAGQRKFNTLIKKIENQREVLQAWETAMPLYLERWNNDFKPLLDEFHQGNIELLHILDEASTRVKLSKTDRQTLSTEIRELASSSMDGENDEALKALYNKHSHGDFDEMSREEDEFLKQGLHEIFGIELGDDVDLRDEEAVAQKVQEHWQAEQAAQQQKPGKKSAQQLREEKTADEASQSVREVYRKLASALHPDREIDPTERERKTALMQRVNLAYAERNLLELLQLQLEIEQIDAANINALPSARLKHYNQVLTEQLNELELEVRAMEWAFKEQFSIEPYDNVTPKNMHRKYQIQFNRLLLDTQSLESLCEAIKDPKTLKAWLKEQRAYQMAREQDDDFFGDDLPDFLFR